ncbi:uncharacterized protein LOC142232966 [Haematobia irritans]|uniref:uncharacterized protein LOC142232966 n=1 Tax=Haematobia irritans TaxID=7368 RepID=UPI003F502197
MEELSLTFACRVCLQSNSEFNSFFDEVEYEEYMKLATLFKKVTNVNISESDTKPTNICHECTEKLLTAFEFICTVEKSEQELEVHLKNIIVADIVVDDKGEYSDIDTNQQINVVDSDIEPLTDVQEIEVLDDEYLEEYTEDKTHKHENVIEQDPISDNSTPAWEPMKEDDTSYVESTSPKAIGSRLSKRMQTCGNFKCSNCDRTFAKMETLEKHFKNAHTPTVSSRTTENKMSTDGDKITCEHCPQSFKRRNNYVRHLISCHSKEAESLSAEDKELAKTKNYKKGTCPYCGETFTQASLIIHIRRHTGHKPYKCDSCDKAFPRRQDLNIHQRRHTGEKPHECSVCSKSFSRANKLARHMRIHTGTRPYQCPECGRSFTQSNDLKIHIRRHTGDRPYRCNVCSESFICGAALNAHRKQKNHHCADDVQDDPFANWRVANRTMKSNAMQEMQNEKECRIAAAEIIEHSEDLEFKMELSPDCC